MENITSLLGLGPLPWLSSGEFALIAVTISTIWSGVGYYAIIFLAGLQTISNDVLEAAVIDGAGNMQRFSKVILPLLRPTMFYITVVSVIGTLQQFPPFMIMTGGGPGQATRVLGLFIYEYAFYHLNMGFACTASLVMFVLVLGFTLVQQRFLRYEV
jgi:ABC-type sugar transport system permease subunit